MQTFLPYNDYRASLDALDDTRLGNQVYRETVTLLRQGWPNHPAARMWRGHWWQLALYGRAGVDVMAERGAWRPSVITRWRDWYDRLVDGLPRSERPTWLGDERVHASHRSNLLRKDPAFYGRHGWCERDDLPYFWPV
jgi:hypothetical protein